MLFFSRTKTIATLAVLALCFLLALPNALPASVRAMLPLFNGPVVLGLDLQGGSHVLLEVDQATLKDQYAKQLIGDIRQALRAQKIPYSGLGKSGDNVTVRITDPSRLDAAMSELRKLVQPIDTSLFGSGSSTKQYDIRQDGDQIIFSFTAAGLEYKIGRAIEQSLDIVGKRINAIGTTEPIIQRQGVDRILVQVPGLQDPSRLKDLLGQTAKLQFRLLCDSQPTSATERPPADCEALPDQKQANQIYWVQTSSRATVDGEDLNDAQPAFDSRNSEPIVSFRFNQQGALKFGQLTRDNVGRPFAIALDNKVVSAPRINEPILGGSGQISGRFTTQEATDLAIVLRSGADSEMNSGLTLAWLGFDPRRHHRLDHRPDHRAAFHGGVLRAVRGVRGDRPHRPLDDDHRHHVVLRHHPHAAGHCRAGARHGHGSRFQRAGL